MTTRSREDFESSELTASNEAWEEASGLFRKFAHKCLTEARASRWCELLGSPNPKQWRKIDPFELWDSTRRHPGVSFSTPAGTLKDFSSYLVPALRQADRLFIFALGHSSPRFFAVPAAAAQAFPWPLEGVLLMPGRAEAFVQNHDDQLMLLR